MVPFEFYLFQKLQYFSVKEIMKYESWKREGMALCEPVQAWLLVA